MTITLAAWLHDLSPFLYQFSPGVGVRYYGLAYAAGFVIAWIILRAMARRGLTPMTPDEVSSALFTLVLGAVVGGRLGYCIAYQPSLFLRFDGGFPFWGVLRLNEGGMASHGGMVGVLLAAWWVTRDLVRTRPVPMRHVCDLAVFAAPPGLLLGRLANFVNGELLGKVVASPGAPAPWWAVKFPQEAYSSLAPPGQEQALAPIVAPFKMAGETDPEAFERVLHTLQAGGPGAKILAGRLAPFISARHPSQLYQGIAEGVVVGLVLLWFWRRPRTPGMVTAVFLGLYGVLRIATETIRLPDANLAVPTIAGLSRGQWLSVGMILAALILAHFCRRLGGSPMGGWGVRGTAA
jgi:phosphatidylglycerol---prolipoprotein diacylglyceryl transferase